MASASHKVPTLYHVPFFASSVPRWLLLELSVPSTSIAVTTLTSQQLRTDDVIPAFSPRRVVPFLAFPHGGALLESGAIALHILETFDSAHTLHPAPDDEQRARFLQGIFTYAAEAYSAVVGVIRLVLGKAVHERDDAAVSRATKRFEKVVTAHLAREIGEDGWYLDTFSAVDIMFGFVLMWSELLDVGLVKDERVRAYYDRLRDREAFEVLFPRKDMLAMRP